LLATYKESYIIATYIGLLATHQDGMAIRASTNRARRRLTTLIETNAMNALPQSWRRKYWLNIHGLFILTLLFVATLSYRASATAWFLLLLKMFS